MALKDEWIRELLEIEGDAKLHFAIKQHAPEILDYLKGRIKCAAIAEYLDVNRPHGDDTNASVRGRFRGTFPLNDYVRKKIVS